MLFSSAARFSLGALAVSFFLFGNIAPRSTEVLLSCIVIYIVTFSSESYRTTNGSFWQISNPDIWLLGSSLMAASVCLLDSQSDDKAPEILVFLMGAAIGKGSRILAHGGVRQFPNAIVLVIVLFIAAFAGASRWSAETSAIFYYRGQIRWSGPWNNPNIYGLLMGTGVVLAIGLGLLSFRIPEKNLLRLWRFRACRLVCRALCLLAAVLMMQGLLYSYSRGAWLATLCGIVYLVWRGGLGDADTFRTALLDWGRPALSRIGLSVYRQRVPLTILFASVVMVSFWSFRQTDAHFIRRIFSVGNANDFSWRNRIAAWEGSFQMIADNPVSGCGLTGLVPTYDYLYRNSKVEEPGAIQMNDYLALGAGAGVPMLVCFFMYIWLSLTRRSRASDAIESTWPQVVCRAGSIVLLVGFLFDGGLFKIATATTFWILIECGSIRFKGDKL